MASRHNSQPSSTWQFPTTTTDRADNNSRARSHPIPHVPTRHHRRRHRKNPARCPRSHRPGRPGNPKGLRDVAASLRAAGRAIPDDRRVDFANYPNADRDCFGTGPAAPGVVRSAWSRLRCGYRPAGAMGRHGFASDRSSWDAVPGESVSQQYRGDLPEAGSGDWQARRPVRRRHRHRPLPRENYQNLSPEAATACRPVGFPQFRGKVWFHRRVFARGALPLLYLVDSRKATGSLRRRKDESRPEDAANRPMGHARRWVATRPRSLRCRLPKSRTRKSCLRRRSVKSHSHPRLDCFPIGLPNSHDCPSNYRPRSFLVKRFHRGRSCPGNSSRCRAKSYRRRAKNYRRHVRRRLHHHARHHRRVRHRRGPTPLCRQER